MGNTVECTDHAQLSKDDPLPIVLEAEGDYALSGNSASGTSAKLAGRGNFLVDFGVLELPFLGEVRSRAGIRYSRLYPRGALELALRKVRSDQERGYDIFFGAHTTGDDSRLDVLAEVGALKYFRSAKVFYRFLFGFGGPFENGMTPTSKKWSEAGSSLGMVQLNLPPRARGKLTVGWCTSLFDNGLEGAVEKPDFKAKTGSGVAKLLLSSTPYISYGVEAPFGRSKASTARFSLTVLPEHDNIEYAVQLQNSPQRGPRDAQEAATISAVLRQTISRPSEVRLRMGTSLRRG